MGNPEGYILGPEAIEDLKRLAGKLKRIQPPRPRTVDRGPAHFPYQAPGERFKNGADELIPAYAVMAIDDVETPENGPELLIAKKPSTTFYPRYAINDNHDVRTIDRSRCHFGPFLCLYDSSTGTPAAWETWGPKPDQWELARGYPGFTVLGVADSTKHLAVVVPGSGGLVGKTDETIDAISSNTPGTGTVSIYYRNLSSGALTDTTMNAEVYNMAGEVASGAYVQLKWIGGDLWIDVENCGA